MFVRIADVVDDTDHAIERKRVGGRLDDRRLIAGIDHRRSAACNSGASGVVACSA
jgi:hypothetical protein